MDDGLLERLRAVPYDRCFDSGIAIAVDAIPGPGFVLSVGEKITWGTQQSLCMPREEYPDIADLPAGSISFMHFKIFARQRMFHIIGLGVEPAYEGQGYMSRMVDWAESAARTLSLPVISVESVSSDRIRSSLRRRGYHEFPINNYWEKGL